MENLSVKVQTDLITFISSELSISRKEAKSIINSRRVFVNNRRVWIAGYFLYRGDTVEFDGVEEKNAELSVIYEDNFIIALNKIPGIITDKGKASLESILREKFKNPELKAIHRLDRDTSGVVLFAKKGSFFDAYKKMWKEKSVKKVYLAISHNVASFEKINIDKVIDGKNALSRVSLIAARKGFSYFRIEPVTGRKHQIRLHLASIRHPIVGDREFGLKVISDSLIKSVKRQMLHSYRIYYRCPFTGRDVIITAPLPSDFKGLLKYLELKGE